MKIALNLAGLALGVVLLAACGSSSSGEGTPNTDGVGGEGAGGEDAGGDAESEASDSCTGCGALEECSSSTGLCVAKSVAVKAGFKIDATEVTRAQYAAWLATNPSVSGQPALCGTGDYPNTDYTPPKDWPPDTRKDHPVEYVDWCDAYMYCKGVGKRLCGKIGGGALAPSDDDIDATVAEWYNACSSGGANLFPYADSYNPTACNGKDAAKGGTTPVGSMPNCSSKVSGYEGVYDMSGNVTEWQDNCDSEWSQCVVLGGSYETDADGWPIYLQCNAGGGRYFYLTTELVGIRCCSD